MASAVCFHVWWWEQMAGSKGLIWSTKTKNINNTQKHGPTDRSWAEARQKSWDDKCFLRLFCSILSFGFLKYFCSWKCYGYRCSFVAFIETLEILGPMTPRFCICTGCPGTQPNWAIQDHCTLTKAFMHESNSGFTLHVSPQIHQPRQGGLAVLPIQVPWANSRTIKRAQHVLVS